MNKIYSLLGIGLLSAATLSSCKEDVFIEGGDELQRGESQTYVAVASIRGYENTDKESSTRANVQDDGSSGILIHFKAKTKFWILGFYCQIHLTFLILELSSCYLTNSIYRSASYRISHRLAYEITLVDSC